MAQGSTRRLVFGIHVALGIAAITAILLSSPWTLGAGGMEALQRIDFRWWLLAPIVVTWGTPILVVIVWRQARQAGIEAAVVRERLEKMLAGRQIPIYVDVDARIPVRVEQPLRIPVELDTKVPIDEEIDIETEVPVKTEIPLDTEVETKVFGIGSIRIPIKTRVPIDLVMPVKTRIHVRSAGLPVKLRDEAVVTIPMFDVPVAARLETRIDLLENLRVAEEMVRKRLGGKTE